MKVIRQLIEAGIEVNIIARSLGNQLLLTALNDLGKSGWQDKLAHVFLWDAAVPDNVLFTSPAENPLAKYCIFSSFQKIILIVMLRQFFN